MSGGNLHKMKIFTISVDSTLSCGIVEKFRKTFFRSPFLGFWLRSQKRNPVNPKNSQYSAVWVTGTLTTEKESFSFRVHKRLIWFQLNLHFSMVFLTTYKRRFSKLNRTKKSGKVESFTIAQHPAFSIFIPQPSSLHNTQQIETWNGGIQALEIIWDLFIQIFSLMWAVCVPELVCKTSQIYLFLQSRKFCMHWDVYWIYCVGSLWFFGIILPSCSSHSTSSWPSHKFNDLFYWKWMGVLVLSAQLLGFCIDTVRNCIEVQ